MEIINDLIVLAGFICRIAFLTYAWLTMMRINTYIKEQNNE